MAKTPATPAKPAAKPAARRSAAKPAAAAPRASRAKAKTAATEAAATTGDTVKRLKEQLTTTTEGIRAEAQRKASEIGDEVGRIYGEAGERAMDAARTGKTKAAEGLEALAKAIEGSASQVDDKLGTQYGDFARSAAETVAGLAGTLEQKDIDELVASTRDFVKKSPAVAIGSAAVVGFMLARLLRNRSGS